MSDPLTTVIAKLCEAILSDSELSQLIDAGNVLKLWEGGVLPKGAKQRIGVSDLPKLEIEPAGYELNYHATTKGYSLAQTFHLVLKIGEQVLSKSYFPARWALLRVISRFANSINLPFVKSIDLGAGSEGRNEDEHPGWNTSIDLTVGMWFTREGMQGIDSDELIISPTSHEDPDNGWTDEENTYDNKTNTKALNLAANYDKWLELSLVAPIICSKIKLWCESATASHPIEMQVKSALDNSWFTVFDDNLTTLGGWQSINFLTQVISAIQIKSKLNEDFSVNEVQLYKI